MNSRPSNTTYFVIANVLVLAVLGYAWFLEARLPDFYYMSVQEDEYIEWASFWAFLLAAVAAVVKSRGTAGFPWFLYGLALFCFVVAMEEISWGQRLLGYRPPVYFLEHNFQQEFNFHNVIDTDYRKLALSATIAGYGVLLPLLALVAPLRRLLERIGVVVPPLGLLPLFAATFLMYIVYPFSHSGEWVELMLGLGMLFAVLPTAAADSAPTAVAGLGRRDGARHRQRRGDAPAARRSPGNAGSGTDRDRGDQAGFRERAGEGSLQRAQAPVFLRRQVRAVRPAAGRVRKPREPGDAGGARRVPAGPVEFAVLDTLSLQQEDPNEGFLRLFIWARPSPPVYGDRDRRGRRWGVHITQSITDTRIL